MWNGDNKYLEEHGYRSPSPVISEGEQNLLSMRADVITALEDLKKKEKKHMRA